MKDFSGPRNETYQAKTKRHAANMRRFHQWAMKNPCVIQISYPRSGRQWLANVILALTKKQSVMPYDVNTDIFGEIAVFTLHGLRFNIPQLLRDIPDKKVIFLVRDPRDCALSGAYHLARGGRSVSEELVRSSVDHTSKYWKEVFQKYYDQSDLTIQYELLCLFPEMVINSLLQFIGEESMISIKQVVEQLDNKSRRSVIFESNRERYESHCLHWQRDRCFLPEFANILNKLLGEEMEHFGYLCDGHDIARWQDAYF